MPTFAELRELVRTSTAPDTSPLYRDLYGLKNGDPGLVLQSIEEWEQLPLLKKETLLRYTPAQRFPAPLSHADELTTSSGTSGTEPLFTFKIADASMEHEGSYVDLPYLKTHADLEHAWLSSFFLGSLRIKRILETMGKEANIITLDPKNLSASVKLAKAVGVANLYVFTFLVEPLGKLFAEAGIADQIRYIDMGGASCTRTLYEYIRATFRNATIISHYAQSELDVLASTGAIEDEDPLEVFKPLPGFFFEIADLESGAMHKPAAGVEGELVVTSLGDSRPSPLIRYRTGDVVRVVALPSAAPDAWGFLLLGRAELDFVRIPGGVLRADEIERVLADMNDRVTDIFSLHIAQDKTAEIPRIKAVLLLRTRRPLDMVGLAHEIADALRVGPSLTFAQGVEKGLYLPLVCEELPPQTELKKPRRIVQEIS